MKILLICQNEQTAGEYNRYFTPAGYALIHYTNPLKAMDNFREIRPEIVIFSETDFPRHWKLAVQFLREQFSRDTSLFILKVDEQFPEEDLHKAHFLGVNGIYRQPAGGSRNLEELESMFSRYRPSPSVRKSHNLVPLGDNRLDMMFLNPRTLQLINGRIIELSPDGAVLKPDEPYKTAGMDPGMIIKGCSIKISDSILNLTGRLEKNNGLLEITFLDGTENWQNSVRESIAAFV